MDSIFLQRNGVSTILRADHPRRGSGGVAEPWDNLLGDLYELAKRAGLKVDELAASLLSDIDEGRAIPQVRPEVKTTEGVAGNLDDLPF
jgi:hypothetical protein